MAIFPEGGRTRDGEIRPFKTAGLKAILGARDWKVYGVVIDGLWEAAKLPDFIRNVSSVRATIDMVGPFSYDGSKDGVDDFISNLRHEMCDKLEAIRRESAAAATK